MWDLYGARGRKHTHAGTCEWARARSHARTHGARSSWSSLPWVLSIQFSVALPGEGKSIVCIHNIYER